MPTTALRVVEREARAFRRLWRGTVFSAFVTPVLFLAALGLGLGGLVDEGGGLVAGLPYLVFVTPGLLAATAMQTAAGDALWPVMLGTKWARTFHAMVATPLRPSDVYTGLMAWTALRITLSATVFLVVGAALGGVPSAWGVLAVPAAVLCGTAFFAPLAAYSATQHTEVSFPLIMRLGVMPLFLFSGTFFPVEQLPGWARPVALASPLWHGVELARSATTGTFDGSGAVGHVLVLVGVLTLGWYAGTRTFLRRLAG
ncbi:MAG: ABC transporter permease [Actinobacteria bacterium]|nr:ABC transporter permease [Actinomycetota bacterium]